MIDPKCFTINVTYDGANNNGHVSETEFIYTRTHTFNVVYVEVDDYYG